MGTDCPKTTVHEGASMPGVGQIGAGCLCGARGRTTKEMAHGQH